MVPPFHAASAVGCSAGSMRRKLVMSHGSSSPVVKKNGQATAVSSPELPAWVQQSAEPSGVPQASGGAATAVGKTFTRKRKAADGLSTKQPASKDGLSRGIRKKKKGSKSQVRQCRSENSLAEWFWLTLLRVRFG